MLHVVEMNKLKMERNVAGKFSASPPAQLMFPVCTWSGRKASRCFIPNRLHHLSSLTEWSQLTSFRK